MFNTGSNSFVLNKQSTVSHHGRTLLISKHLFIGENRVSSTSSQNFFFFFHTNRHLSLNLKEFTSVPTLTQITTLILLHHFAMFCNNLGWHPQMIYSNPPMGSVTLIMAQCFALGEAELVMGKRVGGTCYNPSNEEVVQSWGQRVRRKCCIITIIRWHFSLWFPRI